MHAAAANSKALLLQPRASCSVDPDTSANAAQLDNTSRQLFLLLFHECSIVHDMTHSRSSMRGRSCQAAAQSTWQTPYQQLTPLQYRNTIPNPYQRYCPPWDALTDDIWTQIFKPLWLRDKLRVQQTCRRFHELLANPVSSTVWGKVVLLSHRFKDDISSDVQQLCGWVQRRSKGMSALCYCYCGADSQQQHNTTVMWHALVASTAGTDIRLKLTSDETFPHMPVLSLPTRPELVQRLTALVICVEHADDVAAVCSLTALRHLQMGTHADSAAAWPPDASAESRTGGCQLTQLRTLRMAGVPPAAFFVPGTAACLPQLHSLAVSECLVPGGVLPPEVLRVPSLVRLQLLHLPLHMMPDLRRLPALQELIVSGKGSELDLDASQAECSAELRDALRANPLGGAMGLRKAVLHAIPVTTQECADSIACLPHLEVLGLDFTGSVEGAFWAATLQQRMAGRCSVESASNYVNADGNLVGYANPWPKEDW